LAKTIQLTKYQKARLIGARSLQLALGAPPLIKIPKGSINSVEIAKSEFEKQEMPLEVIHEA
jgi:DNA-directed RNA polymerase subunit K/omega